MVVVRMLWNSSLNLREHDPNDFTFIGVLHACSHVGLGKEGRKLFDRTIINFRLAPKVEQYGCMVDLLGRAELLAEALEIINSMPIKPNTIVWGALLAACKLHRNSSLGELVARELLEMEPDNCGYNVLLSNIYAAVFKEMSLQSSIAASSNENSKIIRPLANFHRSIWSDRFIKSAPGDQDMKTNEAYSLEQVEELKEVRRMLVAHANESLKKLSLIDSLQRVGVAYHFEGEMEKAMEQIYDAPNHGFDDNNNLYTVALRFRLLRQQGYNVPCEVFNKFKSSDGKFKEDLTEDVSGMLCLYEATHWRVHGEDILDEALEFTTARLNSIVTNDHPLATQVMHALKQSLRNSPPRIEARHYISAYQEDKTKNESLLKFAKIDFNLLQAIHQQELTQLSKWWKELGLASKLPYARDRLVESYFFVVGIYFEPHYALGRKIVTKVTALLTIIDDTYDAYGTLEELQLFTDAIERWDLSAINRLPKYMKVLYSAILDVYNEIEEDFRKDGQSYRINYAKKVMKIQIRAYFMEAKWFNEGYTPTFEEYMQTASISIPCLSLIVTSLVGMRGDVVTKETFDWAMNESNKLVKGINLIGRLLDDMTSHKSKGYMMNLRGVAEAYKVVNEACMKPTTVPTPVLLLCVNFLRITDFIYNYKYKDGFTLPHEVLKETITSLFVDPIPM
ncbi:(-)-germacrene D synthase-like [Macadamia integrifolia]|uniref:(-)-germacrene D synthase-like n=1 Tax=Macadamia integrifolia TaxID=60698 RepID=UPI001C4FA90C|nr:(-)-germacrene D synthase-like [Macadamia integrifolia]